jgi:hypothetical protein
MPRKRRLTRLSSCDIPVIDPEDRNAVDDHDLVRHVLVDFDEVAVLPDEIREQLVADLVIAIWAWRAGVKPGKRGLSDEKEAQHIFMADVGRALERAGLSATRWRKTYEGDGPDIDAPESFFFRLVRGLADAFGRSLPKDLKLAGQRASKIQYGVMSPAMKAAQDAELATRRRQRLAGVWGDSLVGVPQSCGELASAYLGFPF